MAAIEIIGLEKVYATGLWRKRQSWGLKGLSLAVQENEVFGYLGPNGAGKTTTLKLLMGLIFPTAGTAKILGTHINDPLVKTQVGFLPEQPYFYDYLTALELLEYFSELSAAPARGRRKRAEAMLARVGLADSGHTQLRKFSKGMLQRVGIAQAIIHDPKIIFLDEPMSGLDPVGRREVRDLIQDLRDEGRTIFFSTHILSDAETLCDRVAILNKGELRGTAVVKELLSRSAGRMEIAWHGAAAVTEIEQRVVKCRIAGETTRALVEERRVDEALEILRRHHARLLSVTPVQGTVEDFFLRTIGAAPENQA